jgi:tetratricopeptide (TPR) repeat protein
MKRSKLIGSYCIKGAFILFAVLFFLLFINSSARAVSLDGRYAVDKKKFWPGGYDRDELFLFLSAQEECGLDWEYPDLADNFEGQLAIVYDASFMLAQLGATKLRPKEKGKLLSMAGLWKDAAKEFRKAAKEDPEDPDLWAACAVAFHAAGKYKDSVKSFQKALALNPDYLLARKIQKDIYRSSMKNQSVFQASGYKDRPKRVTCMGFSFLPPPAPDWTVDKKKYEATLLKDTGRSDFTVVLMARLVPRQGGSGIDALAQYLRDTPDKSLDNDRFRPLTKEVTTIEVKGASCARKAYTFEDRGVPYAPGRVFITEAFDVFCEHLNYPDVLVYLGISQRYENEDDRIDLETEFAPFLKSLEFEPSY